LEFGSELILRNNLEAGRGWELVDKNGATVGRMAKAFTPPSGEIIGVKVAAIMARSKKKDDTDSLKTDAWEVVLPEIHFLPH